MLGVGESVRELAVVGEDEEAFGVLIESSDVIEVLELWREKGVNGGAVEFVFLGADVAAWFLEKKGGGDFGFHLFTVECDGVVLRDARGGVFAKLAVDDDVSILDELVTMPARSFATTGEEFIEADAAVGHGDGGRKKERNQKGSASNKIEKEEEGRLGFAFGLWETDRALSFFPLAALFHEFDAFEPLEDGSLSSGSAGCFEAIMLGHEILGIGEEGREARGREADWQEKITFPARKAPFRDQKVRIGGRCERFGGHGSREMKIFRRSVEKNRMRGISS